MLRVSSSPTPCWFNLSDVKVKGLPSGQTYSQGKSLIALGTLSANGPHSLSIVGIAKTALGTEQLIANPQIGISPVTELRFESVGATVGKEVATSAMIAVAVAAALVILYIALAFRGLAHAFRYGMCAIIAMLHDIAIVISLGSIGGRLFGWQVDALYLTALLTVIGFSIQDKVVVFDRIRENSNLYRRLPFETLVNHSIIQTLQRSINTQLMTVEFMLLALALFGGVTLREFAVILLVGLFSGTYSSIFIASSALVVWENREWKRWFRGGEGVTTT